MADYRSPSETGVQRPDVRVGTKKAIRDATPRNRYGQFEDQAGIIEDIHYGHIFGHENRRILAAGDHLKLNQRQINDYVNARPEFFKIERAGPNMSHMHEKPGIDDRDEILLGMIDYFGL